MNILTIQTLGCLEALSRFVQQVPEDRYQEAYPQLYGGTIGKHVRHILEFYRQLLAASTEEAINYDARNREIQLETMPQQALDVIDQLSRFLASPLADRPLLVDAAVFAEATPVYSSLHRELFYAYEHMVHHMALIKVGCFGMEGLWFSENFGMAYATSQHRSAPCAQ